MRSPRGGSRPAGDETYRHPVEAYAGTYENELLGTLEWTVVNGRLNVRFGIARSEVEVHCGERDQLRVKLLGGSVVTFSFEDGVARSLEAFGSVFERVE